ncbi:MAG: peptidylprolyl isomerase [Fusobacteriaceae bacterium]|nr:peptidylprolyl isomerase [Fusobacteriaceae bacterium]MBN2839090.1 peptidylprolyl isomerase [Fusobacteriaceae bacterium]
MKKIILILFTLLLVACTSTEKKKNSDNDIRAKIYTNKGIINVYLYPEAAPIAVANFINLSEKGFYNGLTFHRVVSNFVIQGGDPKGDGTGGPGYKFEDEFAIKWLNFYDEGMLAMANSGENTNGSQFFITLRSATQLNSIHTIFGEVISTDKDMKIVKNIEIGDKIEKIEIIGNTKPLLEKYKDKISEWDSILDKE